MLHLPVFNVKKRFLPISLIVSWFAEYFSNLSFTKMEILLDDDGIIDY